ncbi:MAG: peptidase M42, partial [Anaerolineae bacterium]
MLPEINVDQMVDFLVGLLNTPSPTGDTDRAIQYVHDAFAGFPLDLTISPKGFLVGTWEGEAAAAPRALTAHVDTLGAMVREIKKNGR